MPIPIVYAATKFGGIGLQNLVTEQGLLHVTFLIGHLRANSDVAKQVIILLETYMLITGTTASPLKNLTLHTYVSSPWIDTLRQFLASIRATIDTPQLNCINLIRTHDQPIMLLASKNILHPVPTSRPSTTAEYGYKSIPSRKSQTLTEHTCLNKPRVAHSTMRKYPPYGT
jgi:hypothetical protein